MAWYLSSLFGRKPKTQQDKVKELTDMANMIGKDYNVQGVFIGTINTENDSLLVDMFVSDGLNPAETVKLLNYVVENEKKEEIEKA